MIVGNTLNFGYGDIAVGSSAFGMWIGFQQFKPPAECGDIIDYEVEWIGEEIKFEITYDEYSELFKLMDKVHNKEITSFSFRDYTFDFTNYNEESIKVVKRHLNNAIRIYIQCCAC